MSRLWRILHLEDELDYAELVKNLLVANGLTTDVTLVANRAEFEAVINLPFDVILADYQLADFNGVQAFQRARDVCPGTPFILLSGAIGEDLAIHCLKSGVTDYVLKQWPERLVPAIRRAVQEAQERAQRRHAETELARRERYFRTLTEYSVDVLSILDREGRFLFNSPSVSRLLGYEPKTLTGRSAFDLIHPEDLPQARHAFQAKLEQPEWRGTLEARFRHANGSWCHLEAMGRNHLSDPDIGGIVVNSRDITDRKLAEEKLRESEAQYRLIFDDNPTPMWIFDQETLAFLEVNDAALQHYGYSRAEFLGMSMRDLRPQEDVPAMIEYFHRLQPNGAPTKLGLAGVWRHRKKDGTLIDVQLKWCRISFKGRQASLNMANDITERKRNEHRDAALAKLGQRLSASSSPLEAARIIKAVAEDLFQWDAFALDLYSAERGLLHPLLDIDSERDGRHRELPVTDQGREPNPMARQVIARGAELVLRAAPLSRPQSPDLTTTGDSARVSASSMFAPIRNRTKVMGLVSIHSYRHNAFDQRDLNTLQTLADHCGGALERIRAEQALRESELLFHSVWQNSVDGMRLTDESGRILFANEAFCRLVGMSRADLEGQFFTIIFGSAHHLELIREQYIRRFRERASEQPVERELALRNGTVVTLEESSCFVEIPGRQPMLLSLFRDVTAQRRLEDQLRQSQKMEAIGQLAGGVAHDFNNILTVIHGHASLLQTAGHPSSLATRSAHQIIQAADRAAGLTRQLLAFSRRQVMQPQSLDLNDIVGNMTKMLARILGEDVALRLIYSTQPAIVKADAGMMEQVLLNLAVNSRDAMPKGGVLTISISILEATSQLHANPERSPGPWVCVSVADTGCGIPPENLPRVFDPFFTTKEVGKGTGLGLATVYGIVKQHRGWVEVESQPGQGSRFSVLLPKHLSPCDEPKVEPPTDVAVQGGTETVLVVEDETPVRELVASFLSRQGYKVLQAASGTQALDLWRQHRDKVDLVLTDLVMPDRINGRELAEKLWEERPKLKVIFTSGYSVEVVGKDFVLGQGLHYLQKPYHPKKLAATIRKCLEEST